MDKRRTCIVAVRVTTAEEALIRRMADADMRSISEWLRELIRREAKRREIWPVEPVTEATP
jgi:hypothetical protein